MQISKQYFVVAIAKKQYAIHWQLIEFKHFPPSTWVKCSTVLGWLINIKGKLQFTCYRTVTIQITTVSLTPYTIMLRK